jgi:hypothetical protein
VEGCPDALPDPSSSSVTRGSLTSSVLADGPDAWVGNEGVVAGDAENAVAPKLRPVTTVATVSPAAPAAISFFFM